MNLYIIESPFQLLCAIEARSYFKLENEKSFLLVKLTKNKKSNVQLKKIANKFSFNKVIFLPQIIALTFSDMFMLFIFFYWKLFNKKFNYLFLGEIKNMVVRSAVNNLNHKNYFFLDDGISTFAIQNELMNNVDINKLSNDNIIIGKLIFFISKLLLLKVKQDIRINWFSCFSLDKLSNQIIIKHQFNFLKSIKSSLICNKNIFHFIGSPISEDGKLSLQDELFHIKKVANYCFHKGFSVEYCVHRRESEIKLNLISSINNIQLRLPTYPLEIDFLLKGISIFEIGSFFSTTLISLPLIYDIKYCMMFEINDTFFQDNFKETYLLTLANNRKIPYINILKEY